jgi:hypothetical protein
MMPSLAADAPLRIGLDFDNTLIDYDAAFVAEAERQEAVAPDTATGKRTVKDLVLRNGGGERAWMRIQGQVYGKGIGNGRLIDGVDRVLETAKARGDSVFIVSHKTQFGHFDESRTDLREAALSWMQDHAFFSRFGLQKDAVFFEDPLEAKISRIAKLHLDAYIDDLAKVLGHTDWPTQTSRIHFTPEPGETPDGAYPCRDWTEIHAYLFGA